MPDLPSRRQRAYVHFPSQRAPYHQRLGGTVSVLYRDPVDAGREHHPVYSDESGC